MSGAVIVVTGASSQIGYFLIPRLLAESYQVIAVSRKSAPEYFSKLQQQDSLTWASAQSLQSLLAQSSFTLLSCGPLALLQNILQDLDPQRIIALSSASIYFKQDSADTEEKQLMAAIIAAENYLNLLAKNKQLELTILRPTLVYGCGLDKNLTRAANLIKRLGFLPIAAKAEGLRQPVHAEDIAVLIINLLSRSSLPVGSWSLAGGSCLSYRQMMVAVFKALGKRPRLLPLPAWLLAICSKIILGISPAMIHRQNQNLNLDDLPARQQLGWKPRKFRLLLAELEHPTL